MQENRSYAFPTRSDTNWPVQLQKIARSLKFSDLKEEDFGRRGIVLSCRENKRRCAVTLQLLCPLFSHRQKSSFLMKQLEYFSCKPNYFDIAKSITKVNKRYGNEISF